MKTAPGAKDGYSSPLDKQGAVHVTANEKIQGFTKGVEKESVYPGAKNNQRQNTRLRAASGSFRANPQPSP